jgi:hypothetical protein
MKLMIWPVPTKYQMLFFVFCCYSWFLYVAQYAEQARLRQEARQAKKGEKIGEDEAAKTGAQTHPPRFLVLEVREFCS